jgi:anti-sigma factor RsiW
MSKCDKNNERLSAYLDGEVAAEEKAEMERHLAGCDACAQEAAQWQVADTAARSVDEPSAGAWDGMWRRIGERTSRERIIRVVRWSVVKAGALAAAAAAVLLAVYFFVPRDTQVVLPTASEPESFKLLCIDAGASADVPVVILDDKGRSPVVMLSDDMENG